MTKVSTYVYKYEFEPNERYHYCESSTEKLISDAYNSKQVDVSSGHQNVVISSGYSLTWNSENRPMILLMSSEKYVT